MRELRNQRPHEGGSRPGTAGQNQFSAVLKHLNDVDHRLDCEVRKAGVKTGGSSPLDPRRRRRSRLPTEARPNRAMMHLNRTSAIAPNW
jgi:hypothetical protein